MKKKLMIGMALALCATGLQAATIKPEKSVMAIVNGTKITAGELTIKLWWQNGAAALSELIDEKVILEEAARLKIKADAKEVESRMVAMFSSADKAQFEKNLKALGWSEADLRELVTRQLTIRDAVMSVKKIAVTEDEMKTFFESNSEKMITPEAVDLRQIFVNTRAEADALLETLAVGADFAKLSALKSADATLKKNSGSLGFINKGTLLPEIEKEIFALQEKTYSTVIPTGNGFSIFYVESHRTPQPAVFEKVKDELKVAMLNQSLSQKLPEFAKELRLKAKIEILP